MKTRQPHSGARREAGADTDPGGTRRAATAGMAAAIAGAGVGHLVAALVSPEASPLVAVGSTVIDAAPTPVKEWAVSTFGTADKPILVCGIIVVTLAAAAACGLVARRRLAAGAGGLIALAMLATAAAVVRQGASVGSLLPGVVTALVGLAVLAFLVNPDRLGEPGGARDAAAISSPVTASPTMIGPRARPTSSGMARRAFFAASAGFVVMGGVAALFGQRLMDSAQQLIRPLPKPATSLPPQPMGLEAQVPGVTPLRTPQADFYRVDTALLVPRVDVEGWRLTVEGSVARRLSLSYDELLALPMIEKDITLMCVSNEVGGKYAGSARWLGVRVSEVLRMAGVGPEADQILSRSVDGYTCSTPTAALLDDRGALIVVGMNGEPLDQTHGFPARLVTPGLYGYVGATKWLTTLTATTFAAEEAYWTRRGWAAQAPVKTTTRIDTPTSQRRVTAGEVAIGGVAWAPRRGIRRIEVQVDDGPWQQARLGPNVGVDYWRQWWMPWQARSGQHTLRARATDGTGTEQTSTRASPFPDGASGIHEVVVDVD